VEPESLNCPEDFLIEISGKNGFLNVNIFFKLTSKKGLIHRTLMEKEIIEQKFIIKNILKPTYL
jgi:hypothetical protein